MSNKMTKKAQGYLPIYGPEVQGQMPTYKPIKSGSAFYSLDQFARMTDPITQGVQEQKRRPGTAKKDNFYNNYVVPTVNTLAQLTPTPAIARTIAAYGDTKKLEHNIKQYQKLHDDQRFWERQYADALRKGDSRRGMLAAQQLALHKSSIRKNVAASKRLSGDITGLVHTAGTSARNALGIGPMIDLYNMFASQNKRVPNFLDPTTHQHLANMSPELRQMAGHAISAAPIADIGNLIFYSALGAGPASGALRMTPAMTRVPNAIQFFANPGLRHARDIQRFANFALASQAARSTIHNAATYVQHKNQYPVNIAPFLAWMPGPPLPNSNTFSAQFSPHQIRVTRAIAASNAAQKNQPIPKSPKVYSPYLGPNDVLSSVPGNLMVNFHPLLHGWDTASNYMQYVPIIAPHVLPQQAQRYMPWFRGLVDPSAAFTRLAGGPGSMDASQQQRAQWAARAIFKDPHKFTYWPAPRVIESSLYKNLQDHDNLALAYADYVRTAAGAGAAIKDIPLPGYRNWPSTDSRELRQDMSVFYNYADALDTPNAFAGMELVRGSKEAKAVRDTYMNQLSRYISLLPDDMIADLALGYQLNKHSNNNFYITNPVENSNRLFSPPVLNSLPLAKDRLEKIRGIYGNKLMQVYGFGPNKL